MEQKIKKTPPLIGVAGKIGSGKDTIANIINYLHQEEDWDSFAHFMDESSSMYDAYKNQKFASKLKDIACLLLGCTREKLEDREFKEKELGEEWWYICVEDDDGNIEWKEPYNEKKWKEWDKNHYYHSYLVKQTPRKLMQLLGTEGGRDILHPNIWVNALFADYKATGGYSDGPHYPNWIITDVRFPNEAQAIKDRGGIVIRVERNIVPTLEDCKKNLVEVKRTFLDGTVKTKEDFDSQPWLPYEYVKGDDPFLERALNGRNSKNSICGIRLITSNHTSETALDDYDFDHVIDNNGSIEELVEKVKQLKLV
tara:strand:- start:16608 stop:17540 length:933 start_codon:yes stop_codon:yes gene_type:complete